MWGFAAGFPVIYPHTVFGHWAPQEGGPFLFDENWDGFSSLPSKWHQITSGVLFADADTYGFASSWGWDKVIMCLCQTGTISEGWYYFDYNFQPTKIIVEVAGNSDTDDAGAVSIMDRFAGTPVNTRLFNLNPNRQPSVDPDKDAYFNGTDTEVGGDLHRVQLTLDNFNYGTEVYDVDIFDIDTPSNNYSDTGASFLNSYPSGGYNTIRINAGGIEDNTSFIWLNRIRIEGVVV